MPIYEYRCKHCGHELEAIRKLSEPPLTFCPACETEGLKKKISAAVFRLRGGGWYETDFKSDNKKNVAGDDNGAAKENGKETSSQQGAAGSDTDKSGKGGESDSTAKDKPKSDAKLSGSKSTPPE